MRRMRRHYRYTTFDENDSEGDTSMSTYFLLGQQNRDYDNIHSIRKQHGFMSMNDLSRNDNMYRSDEMVYKSLRNDDHDNHHNQKDNHGGSEDKDDDDDGYEVVSDRYLSPSKSTSSFTERVTLPKRFSDLDIPNTRRAEMSPLRPIKKNVVCKFCASSKQFGSCPCPIHLPTVQSRYLRSIQDNTRNAMTINVFRNGDYRSTPTMIHFSKFNVCSMEEIMKIIDNFIRFPVGYAYALYTLLGDLIDDPADLEPYEMYVVVNNCKKQFIPLEYGSKTPSTLNVGKRRRAFALAPFIRG